MWHLVVLLEELCKRGINFRALAQSIFAQQWGDECCKSKTICDLKVIVWFLCEQKIFIRNDYVNHFILPTASLSKEKNTPVFPEWIDFFIQPHFSALRLKKCLILMRNIIISSWCLWWAVNTIHLRCLFRMNPLVWCLWADVAAKLRSLKRYSVFTFQRMKFMNRTSPYYCRRSVLSLLISALTICPALDDGLHSWCYWCGKRWDCRWQPKSRWTRYNKITLILSTMASRMFMAGYLMEVLLNRVDIKM